MLRALRSIVETKSKLQNHHYKTLTALQCFFYGVQVL